MVLDRNQRQDTEARNNKKKPFLIKPAKKDKNLKSKQGAST